MLCQLFATEPTFVYSVHRGNMQMRQHEIQSPSPRMHYRSVSDLIISLPAQTAAHAICTITPSHLIQI